MNSFAQLRRLSSPDIVRVFDEAYVAESSKYGPYSFFWLCSLYALEETLYNLKSVNMGLIFCLFHLRCCSHLPALASCRMSALTTFLL